MTHTWAWGQNIKIEVYKEKFILWRKLSLFFLLVLFFLGSNSLFTLSALNAV